MRRKAHRLTQLDFLGWVPIATQARPPGSDVGDQFVDRGSRTAPYGIPLSDAVAALEQPEGEVDVFVHGEREAIKRIGAVLHGEWGIARQAMSLLAYWAYGRAEDAFQDEKRTPVGQIFRE